jgi:hypothetical protein
MFESLDRKIAILSDKIAALEAAADDEIECQHMHTFEFYGEKTCKDCGKVYDTVTLEWRDDE